MKQAPVPEAELQRSKDHLKGSLMLSLENTASRMSHLARQEIYFDRQFGLDETLLGIERVTAEDVQRVAADLFRNGSLAAGLRSGFMELCGMAGRSARARLPIRRSRRSKSPRQTARPSGTLSIALRTCCMTSPGAGGREDRPRTRRSVEDSPPATQRCCK